MTAFGWILYSHGTHLVPASRTPKERTQRARLVEAYGCFGVRGEYPEALFYFWDGVGLHRVERERWIELVNGTAEEKLTWRTEVRA